MVRHPNSGFYGLPRLCGAAVLMMGLGLVACAKAPKPIATADPRPMVAPVPPPPSPDFNVKVAKPLPTPVVPTFEPLPVPAAPPPPVVMAALDPPEPVALPALPALAPPPVPPQRDKPILRPAEPAHDTVSALETLPPHQAPQQTAALPIAVPPSPASRTTAPPVTIPSLRLEFTGESTDFPATAPTVLDQVAALMTADPQLRFKLRSFATGPVGEPVVARKLSLQRALKVRAALVDRGIGSTRVDVLALGTGSSTEAGPPDRIDLVPAD